MMYVYPTVSGHTTYVKVQKYEQGKIGLQLFYMFC